MATSGHTTFGVKEFVVDTEGEVFHIPTDCAVGSTAFVISTSKAFMLNGEKEWVEI